MTDFAETGLVVESDIGAPATGNRAGAGAGVKAASGRDENPSPERERGRGEGPGRRTEGRAGSAAKGGPSPGRAAARLDLSRSGEVRGCWARVMRHGDAMMRIIVGMMRIIVGPPPRGSASSPHG